MSSLCLVWECINLVIKLLFANSFRVSQILPDRSMDLLIDGLEHAKHPLIQEQALFELHQLLMKNPQERAKLFSQFIKDTAVSKIIAEWLLKKLKTFSQLIKDDLGLLRQIEQVLNKPESEPSDAPTATIETNNKDGSIFKVKQDSWLFALLKRVINSNQSLAHKEVKKDDKPTIPPVLSITKKLKEMKSESIGEPQKVLVKSWFASNISTLTGYWPGRYLSGAVIQYYRNRNVDDDHHIIWIIEAIAQLASVSYEEDSLGQIQFLLNDMLKGLLEFFFLIIDIHGAPILSDPSRIVEVTLSDESELTFHRLLQTCSGAIDELVRVFGESFDKQPSLLSPATRAILEKYQVVLEACAE